MPTNVFINEIHYDNIGTDTGEAIEIAGLGGLDLFGWSLVLYNGANGLVYNTISLTGTIPNQNNGFGTASFSFPTNGIQNGSPDGIALVDNNNNVVQFLSYEGTFTALDGPAIGLTSTDIGVTETSSTPVGESLQLTGTGTTAEDFTWTVSTDDSFGTVNSGQSFTNNSSPTININEIRIDQPSTDNDEYFELTGTPGTSLNGFTYIVIGDGTGGSGVIEAVVNLDGSFINSNGFFVAAENTFTLGTADLITSLNFENSDNVTHLLVEGFTGTNGQDLDTNDDGVLDITPWTTVLDSVALLNSVGSGDLVYSQTTIGPDGSSVPGHVFRSPDGTGNFQIGNFDPNGGDDTPGAENDGGVNPPPNTITRIYDIQGEGHISSFNGQTVVTTGIVTAVDTNGFYLQDETGDGNVNTSDGIFVFTSSLPTVAIGDELEVQGTVSEFTPGGTSTGNLSVTQIGNATITTLSTGNALPTATIIGSSGRIPPTQIIDNDNFATFDPQQDGIDFYETLEGMLVTVEDAISVSPTNRFSEIFVTPNQGTAATGLNSNGGLTLTDTDPNITPTTLTDIDFNPERIQIDDLRDPGVIPPVTTGTLLGDITGVVSYNFGNYEVLVDTSLNLVAGTGIQQGETTTVVGSSDRLTVASYNLLNLDPNDADGDTDVADGRFTAIATQIVNNLQTPDIIGLQEVQDNDGSVNSNITSASTTLQMLVDAIAAAGGPQYQFIDNPFIGDDTNGGQPGGNIRTAYLYNPNRVNFVQGSLQTTTDPNDQQTNSNNPFFASRLPLAATFSFNGENVTVVNNHFSSRGGSDPLVGTNQPPTIGGEQDRLNQAQSVQDFTNNLLTNDPNTNVVVLGDLNGFQFETYQKDVLGSQLTNLTNTLDPVEAYTYIFEGNSQALDHIFVSDSLLNNVQYDAVHINADFVENSQQASDHDGVVAGLFIPTPENIINGTTGQDILTGTNGNDVITGFQSRDRITTGNGSDHLVYNSVVDGGDIITDFSVGNDKFVFTQLLDSVGYNGSNPITDGYVRFLAQGSNTMVQFDPDGLNGSGLSRSFILVQNVSISALNDVNNFVF
ncbi:endonuclease [Crocosphaera sp. UHCC 0190]|uniref:endonuclease/exonuclease/phosphatase family protein n=1 Tax=Crocosphaera sp. UHCC 0190 TaxID=3110246 RepID=UPI002B1EF094|nr:endonuclease [Crocosphaera sp. UHCC 0190]MEA5511546.1 endonuclease [Crocosphaera sp. UHCC 0190]